MARLFHVPLSPFCRKVRLSLAEKKVEVESRRGTVLGGRIRTFMRRNPAGKGAGVSQLDGIMMAESAAICEYIEETRGPTPQSAPERPCCTRLEVRRLV